MNLQKMFGYEQKDIEVNGTVYTMQNMPFKQFYEMQERHKDKHGNLISSKVYDEIFQNVIISPKVSWENFKSVDEIEALMSATYTFLTGEKQPVQE
ncbi:MAG: hypothetical protein ACTTHM_04630 [Peptoanaerobacter stomatis]|uniref:hypothetical protein n=1 Tax=Peptoanaerobacter stomatis TaxID=796937 RepID=UPI003FA08B61